MLKKFNLILCCLICIKSFNIVANDINLDTVRTNFKNEQTKNKNQLVKIDSLQTKIKDYELSKEYYQTSIGTLTAIFSLICGGFFILFGLLSYSGFRNEVNKIKKESIEALKIQQDKFNDFNKNIGKIQDKITLQSARIYVLIANFFEINKMYVSQLTSNLHAAQEFSILKTQDKACISNLGLSKDALKLITVGDEFKEQMLHESKELIKIVDKIFTLNMSNDEIKNLCIEIRLSIINYLKETAHNTGYSQ
jgi:hypothetical protein